MEVVELRIDSIIVDESRVRTSIDEEAMEGLIASIDEVGMLHPILVKPASDAQLGDGTGAPRYRLVAGWRRLQASIARGATTVPAVILSDDVDTLQVQLIENLQREDLNPVERALAVHEFMKEYGLNKSTAAERLGVPRTTLTDWLDLLEVAPRFRDAVIENFHGGDSTLTPSHVSEALALARRLNSPTLHEVLLDAVLVHKLSKGETRHVAKLIRENRDLSVEEAIRTVRGTYQEEDEAVSADLPESLLPHEENLSQLVRNLGRTTRYLERLNHISGRFIEPEQVDRLIERYQEIIALAERALARLRLEDPELQKIIEESTRPSKARKRRTG